MSRIKLSREFHKSRIAHYIDWQPTVTSLKLNEQWRVFDRLPRVTRLWRHLSKSEERQPFKTCHQGNLSQLFHQINLSWHVWRKKYFLRGREIHELNNYWLCTSTHYELGKQNLRHWPIESSLYISFRYSAVNNRPHPTDYFFSNDNEHSFEVSLFLPW